VDCLRNDHQAVDPSTFPATTHANFHSGSLIDPAVFAGC
jgi:hypothetical protein